MAEQLIADQFLARGGPVEGIKGRVAALFAMHWAREKLLAYAGLPGRQ